MTALPMWTVYENPVDYPGKFVARRFDVDAAGPKPTDTIVITADLKTLRDYLAFDLRLTCLARSEGDDPKIIETWL